MEKRVPFIAEVISGIVTWILTVLFLKSYLGLMTVVLIAAYAIGWFEPWSFTGSFLIGLVLELYGSGQVTQFCIVSLLLVGGSIIQATVAFIRKDSEASYGRASSVRHNTVFAVIGMAFSVILQFMICPNSLTAGVDGGVAQTCQAMLDCHVKWAFEILYRAGIQQDQGLAQWNAIALVCARAALISPFLWASAFAALRQIRFRVRKLDRLISQTVKGIVGAFLIGPLIYAVLLVVLTIGIGLYVFLIPVAPAFSPDSLSTPTIVLILSVAVFGWALGTGWAVTWGSD